MDWLKGKDAIGRLRLGLWSLESLYKLRNTVASSLVVLEDAKKVLMSQIEEGRFLSLHSYILSNVI